MFQSELLRIEKKYKSAVKSFCFRDKRIAAWGKYKYSFELENGEAHNGILYDSAYIDLFLKGEIIRDSCTKCPYARPERVSDITIGDAWGAETIYPDFKASRGGVFNFKNGLSLVAINTDKGEKLFSELCSLKKKLVDYGAMVKYNRQLRFPIGQSPNKVKYMRAFEKYGISGLYSERLKIEWLPMLKRKIRKLIPNWIKQKLKKI